MKRLIVMALPFLPCLAFASLQVQVVDQAGLPAADCSVMVGMKAGEPFAGNVQKTDATGLAKFAVSGISDQPVTVAKSGYPRITYYNQSEETAVLRPEDDLRSALSLLLSSGKDTLRVENASGKPLGEVGFSDLRSMLFAAPSSEKKKCQ